MMQAVSGALLGALFGVGLALAGMTQPAKVIGFLDFTGTWDPSLAFVMAGAIMVFAPLNRFIMRETKPLYVQKFVVFAGRQIDRPLVVGAAVFGVGWGLAGLCPGPALVSVGTGKTAALVFALCMIAGMAVFEGYDRTLARLRAAPPAASGAP
ncbi:MAG: DUF6691 family protein [Polyangiales bacterium]